MVIEVELSQFTEVILQFVKDTHPSILNYSDYKAFLEHLAGPKGSRQGFKSQAARILRCQPTYVTQIIYQDAHLSLEQADSLSIFLGFTEIEKKYFLLLVQLARAGTISLKSFFKAEIESLKRESVDLTKQLGKRGGLSDDEKAEYYSSWIHAAIHMALLNKDARTPRELSKRFQLPEGQISASMGILRRIGIIANDDKGGLQVRLPELRLGKRMSRFPLACTAS